MSVSLFKSHLEYTDIIVMETVYVTVGTTKFDALLEEITSYEALEVLRQLGCRKLIIQRGTGKFRANAELIKSHHGIEIEQYNFKTEAVRTDIIEANLVIGHAGAGTCIDVLRNEKPALIVINEHLMDNHQSELAMQLAEDGHIYQCNVGNLIEQLSKVDFTKLKPYQKPRENLRKFINYLYDVIN